MPCFTHGSTVFTCDKAETVEGGTGNVAFQDVIDDYGNGATGTMTAADGTVGYTVTSTVDTLTRPNTDAGAQVSANGDQTVEVAFDDPVRGVTLKFDRSNQPEIYRVRIDGQEVDIQDLIDSGAATFTTVMAGTDPIQPGTHTIAEGGVTSAGPSDNGSLGFLTLNTTVESVAVFGSGGGSGNWDLIEVGIDTVSSAVVCFCAVTKLQTPEGPRDIRDLIAGDRVITQSGQVRPIVAVSARHLRETAVYGEIRLLPVRIAVGALGGGLPRRDLWVSRQHRLLVASRIARRIFGQAEVLIAAIHLVGLTGSTIDRVIRPISYHHVLLADHDIALANGAPAETLLVGPVSAAALQDDLADLVPGVLRQDDHPAMTPAWAIATAQQSRRIVAAHIRNRRPPLERLLGMMA